MPHLKTIRGGVASMHKRGQLSLFLLLGVIILFVLIGFSVLPSLTGQRLAGGCDGLLEHIEIVAGDSLDYCLKKVGYQGGRYEHQNAFWFPGRTIEKAFDGTSVLVSQEGLSKELETCISETAVACFGDFGEFRDLGCKITADEFVPHVVLATQDISIAIDYRVEANGKTIRSFKPENREVRLSALHEFIDDMAREMNGQIKPADFNLDRLAAFSGNVSILQTPDGTQVFRLTDHNSRIRDAPFEFTSVNAFSMSEDRNT